MRKYNIVNNALGWLCFAIAAVTYLLTLEPTASFWDCPEFIAQGAKLEVGHPPGNPIFMLAARFFVTLFGNNIANAAVAVNSMSALLSAGTILLLFWTITHLVRKIVVRDDATEVSLPKMLVIMGAGVCGALAYTWSDTFWFSAVEGEVYAFSSFCTALVIWLILKWENRADQPHSDRYLVLIAYVIGVSIAVHLLNLLCIPAIVLVFYYRKWANPNAKGSLIALGVSVVIVAAILYGLVPGFIEVAQYFELFFVNTVGLSYNMGVLIYAVLLVALFVWSIATINAGKNAMLMKVQMLLIALLSGLVFATDSGLVWAVLIAGVCAYLFIFCKQVPQRVFNVVALSIFVIFIGYSSYALLLIRASANTPMNQNAPDNVFALSSYLNREQYGQRPLLYGTVFADTYTTVRDDNGMAYVMVDEQGLPKMRGLTLSDVLYYKPDGRGNLRAEVEYKRSYEKKTKLSPDEPDKYVDEVETPDYKFTPDLNMLFPRVYSMDDSHVRGYKSWAGYVNPDIANIITNVPSEVRAQWASQQAVPLPQIAPYLSNVEYLSVYENSQPADKIAAWKPSMLDNVRYFLNYQLNHMYWRYFMWNFAGRQNDIQGNGEPYLGNWISGIPAIDNMRLGDQSLVPERFTTGNKGHNVFYMLPLLLGLLGIAWQALSRHPYRPQRGIEQFWVVFFLFFMTGIAIVLYLNQTPGQPRERDYAFAGSFYAFSIWVGMGVPAIAWLLGSLFKKITGKKDDTAELGDPIGKDGNGIVYGSIATACVVGLLVPLQMVSQTWDDHDRSHRYTTRDFGANYLNSLAPNAIIFTNGDNDTFPLWYAQEVEGERTDVRVINLSYLSTDWYANQIKHPTYDAKAVKTTGEPKDWAYDKLSWTRKSQNPSNARVPALEGLKGFYANASAGISTPNMYSPVDAEAAIKAFGLNPASADSVHAIPYIQDVAMPGFVNGGSLSTLLSFDIVANSIADGFERPVYIATTVPSDYYLGLQPYMYSTGMAQQITPFRNAPVSPVADKAYENVMSKFRWGGLDDSRYNTGLYLDETVRRMVSTTRNTMIDLADQLMGRASEPATEWAVKWAADNGQPVPATRADMARAVINLMLEKLPAEATPMENLTDIQTVSILLQLYALDGNQADLDMARKIVDASLPYYAALSNYWASEPSSMAYAERQSLQYAHLLLGYKNFIDMQQALADKGLSLTPQQREDLAEAMRLDSAVYIFDFLMMQEQPIETLRAEAERGAEQPTSLSDLCRQAVMIYELNEQAGIDLAKQAAADMAAYGASLDVLRMIAQR